MSGARKRFWKTVGIVAEGDGFAIQLDGRPLKTPAKAPLVVPTRAIADLVAAEWQAQETHLHPETMPATRAANAAIDKVRGQFHEVAGLLTAYGETDLLCYRAAAPVELVALQAQVWDPLLDWAAGRFGLRWQVTTGVMPTPQPAETLAILGAHVAGFSAFHLTAFHDLVAMSGSLVIGLAVTEGIAPVEDLWRASRIDEEWQARAWGEDEEASAQAERRHQAFLAAARFHAACSA